VVEFGHHLAGTLAGIDTKADLALIRDACLARAAQRLESPDTALVAGPACLDALADPHLLLLPELVEFAVMYRLDFQLFGLFELICREIAPIFTQLAAIKLDNSIGDIVQKAPVVGNEHERATIVVEQVFQPLDG
jgi:hypothetical protein